MTRRADWAVPLALLALSFVPVVAGAARLAALGAGDTSVAERFVRSPWPIALHVIAATTYAVLGALQFSRVLRLRRPAWHRGMGRVAGLAGVVTAGTGLWMALTYPIPPAQQGPLLLGGRLVVGVVMLAAIVLAIVAIRRRDVAAHEAWMVRAYALGQGAGTQVLLLGIPSLALGELQGSPRDLLMVAAWGLNAAVAERSLRRPSRLTSGVARAGAVAP